MEDVDDSPSTQHTRGVVRRCYNLFETAREQGLLIGKLVAMVTNAQGHQSKSGRKKGREHKFVRACRVCRHQGLFDMLSRFA